MLTKKIQEKSNRKKNVYKSRIQERSLYTINVKTKQFDIFSITIYPNVSRNIQIC